MKKRLVSLSLALLFWVLLDSLCPMSSLAQQNFSAPPATQNQHASPEPSLPVEGVAQPAQVTIEGRGPILTVFETVGGLTPEQRAAGIKGRIVAIARSGASTLAARLEPHEGWTAILVGDQVIMAVTNADARAAGKSRQQMATEYADKITSAIHNYQEEHSWRMILQGGLKTIVLTLVLVGVLWFIRRVRSMFYGRIEKRIVASAQPEQKSAWNIAVAYIGPIMLGIGAILRWLFILALLEAYLTISFGFFSVTRDISLTVTKWVVSQLEFLAESGLNYLPNLLIIAVIALITRYVLRLLRLFFGEIGKGNLKIRGFYPDWAEPTEDLVRMLVLVLAVVVAFPYLPGAKSPAFQGISIFLGVLLSLGSSSAVANAIAGVILTYMRSFLVGDWVQIGDTTGEVVEKNLLVTRVLTPKEEIITLPNATVMSGSVKNYSVEAKKSGVIFHTTATIGYDAPWRTVHELLIDAARATKHVLKEPAPFVLQNGLDDFYVEYELNAYTDVPREMLNIFSELHQNIQDKFNEAGVEICSPHFSSLRDGNIIAIPEQYIKANYEAPGFRVQATERDQEDRLRTDRIDHVRQAG